MRTPDELRSIKAVVRPLKFDPSKSMTENVANMAATFANRERPIADTPVGTILAIVLDQLNLIDDFIIFAALRDQLLVQYKYETTSEITFSLVRDIVLSSLKEAGYKYDLMPMAVSAAKNKVPVFSFGIEIMIPA